MSTATLGSPIHRPINRTRERAFFGSMTLIMIATVLLGFRASYFPLGERPGALASGLIVAHGVVFSLYLALFLVQVSLVSVRKVSLHKSLGMWVYGLAALMIPLGVIAAADELRRDVAANAHPQGADPQTFSIVSVTGMVMFGTLLAISYAQRRSPNTHKRLALYATLSMMDAGSDRWPWQAWGISESWSLWFYTLLLLLPVFYDLASRRRILGATLFAAPFAWTLHRMEIPLGHTAAWHWIAGLMLKYMPWA